jgi:hypothetical protein
VRSIALSTEQVGGITPELLVAHRFHILEDLCAFTPPPQQVRQPPQPDPATDPEERNRPVSVQRDSSKH